MLAGIGALGANRILLTAPFIAAVHEREIAVLAAHGWTVMGGDLMGINTNAEMAQIPPEAIAAQARGAARAAPGADACFISCTAIRSAGVIEALEAELGMPVITSNQVMAWHVLRRLGLQDQSQGFGRLMALT